MKSIYFILYFLNIAPEKIKNTDLNQSIIITFMSGKKFFVLSDYCWATVSDKKFGVDTKDGVIINYYYAYVPSPLSFLEKNRKSLLYVEGGQAQLLPQQL